MGEKRNVYNCFGSKSWRMGPLGKSRRIWEDNIQTDIKEMEGRNAD